MTQDQSLDNGHQAISNNHPTNDQAGDDLNISKNSTVSNGVNSVQDFNVVANSKRRGYSTDVAIMQNRSVDAISAAAGSIFVNSNQSVVGSNDNIISEQSSSDYVSDVTNGGVDKLISEMTVITHQNSGENICEIIANSNDTNKISNETQLVNVESNVICEKNVGDCANTETKKPNQKEIIKPEDPIDRLNKLRASISNALSEVKGVLRQYSTDQDCDGENKCSLTEQQTEKGPVKFRFVRKIRRRSVFSEDENEQNSNKNEQSDNTELRIVNTENANLETKTSECKQNQTKIKHKESSSVINEKPDDKPLLENNNSDTNILVQSKKLSSKLDPHLKILDIKKAKQEAGNENDYLAVDSPQKVLKQCKPISLDPESAPLITATKILRSANRKAIKKERRASVAAVNLNQGLNDELVPQLEFIRRPSDSGTFVKQPTEIKSKIKKKVNVGSQNRTKTEPAIKTIVSKAVKSDVVFDQSGNVQTSTKNKLKISIDNMSNMSPKNENIEVSGNVIQITNKQDLVEVQSELSQLTKTNSPHEEGKVIEGDTTNFDIITTEESKNENTSTSENIVVAVSSSQTTEEGNEKVANNFIIRLDKESDHETELKMEKLDLPSPATILNHWDTKSHPMSSDKTLQTVKDRQSKTQQLPPKVENKTKLTKTGISENKLITLISDTKAEEQTKLDQAKRNVEKNVEATLSVLNRSVSLDFSKDDQVNELDLRNQDLAPVCINTNSPANTNATESTSEDAVLPKKKITAKRKVVIRRIRRKLSKDDTFINTQETPAELEVCEKEIEEKTVGEESEEKAEIAPVQRKPCLKKRQFEIGDVVMYAERFKRTQVKWRKATVIERITSISYKLNIEGEEKPAHISYIKKFTDRKVNFGGKEYLEIDYAQIEEDEEKERNYSIWNLV